MQKKALLALALAMTLMLSGCALIVKDEAVDAATPIITRGDKVITKGEVQNAVNSQLNYMSYLYSIYGYPYDATDAANIAEAQETAIQDLEEDIVIREKIEEMGITLTEEEEAQAMETAQSNFDSHVEYAKSAEFADSELEGDELTNAAVEYLAENGVTLESYQTSARDNALDTKMRDEIIKDVEVTEEELQAEYQSHVDTDKETYGENPGTYADTVNKGTTVYYAPEGVRRVKQILVKFHDEDQTVIDEANSKVTEANTAVTTAEAKVTAADEVIESENTDEEAKTKAAADKETAEAELADAQAALEAAQAELKSATDAAFANLDEETDAILAELEGGADWETLMAEKNQDPGMQSGETAEKGYAVSADMTSFDQAFVQAAMDLKEIGAVSAKTRGESYGYYIIKYFADEPAGEIGLDAVRESLSSSLLSTKQNTKYTDTIAQWVEEAGFKVDRNALNN